MQLAPKSSSFDDLKEHGEGIARALGLSYEQAAILVAEVRNALSPAVISAQGLAEANDPEDLADLRTSLARVLALMDAICPEPAQKSALKP